MKVSFHFVLVLATSQFLMLFFAPSVLQNSSTNSNNTAKGVPMTARATGTFEVKLAPLPTMDMRPTGEPSLESFSHSTSRFTATWKAQVKEKCSLRQHP